MSVFSRYKRGPEGFRALVELWESTPLQRRQRMIEIGREEDPAFVDKALQYVMNFEDLVKMPDVEMAELMAAVPARVAGMALAGSTEEVSHRFIRNSQPVIGAEIRDVMQVKFGPREVQGAQLKMIQIARDLEKKNLIHTKRIPLVVT